MSPPEIGPLHPAAQGASTAGWRPSSVDQAPGRRGLVAHGQKLHPEGAGEILGERRLGKAAIVVGAGVGRQGRLVSGPRNGRGRHPVPAVPSCVGGRRGGDAAG